MPESKLREFDIVLPPELTDGFLEEGDRLMKSDRRYHHQYLFDLGVWPHPITGTHGLANLLRLNNDFAQRVRTIAELVGEQTSNKVGRCYLRASNPPYPLHWHRDTPVRTGLLRFGPIATQVLEGEWVETGDSDKTVLHAVQEGATIQESTEGKLLVLEPDDFHCVPSSQMRMDPRWVFIFHFKS